MPAHADFLQDLVVVLGVATFTSLVFTRLKIPVVLGYVLAGIIVGPHVPIPLVANQTLISTLSELGVILLMFSIGLEFSIRKLANVGASAAITATMEVTLMVGLGMIAARLCGFSTQESLFVGAMLAISSTMLVAKSFEEKRVSGGFAEVVFAILVFEDILAIVLLAVLTAVAKGANVSANELAVTVGKLLGFLAVLLAAGLLLVPRLVRFVVDRGRSETTLVVSMALCFGLSMLAQAAGYSVALGAFVAGLLIAESGKGHAVEPLIHPFRDIFAAIFFVSVGMTVEPSMILAHWKLILLFSLIVLVGKSVFVTIGSFLAGNGLTSSVQAGLSLAQIGEFSFIIVGIANSSGMANPTLLPVAVSVSCITALCTPFFIGGSHKVVARLDSILPARLQTFVSFYDSWIQDLRSKTASKGTWSQLKKYVYWLIFDALLLGGTIIATSLAISDLTNELVSRAGISATLAWCGIVVVAGFLGMIFLRGMLRQIRTLAFQLATRVVPQKLEGHVDLGRAPRRALVATLEFTLLLVSGLPLTLALSPFVGSGTAVFAAIMLLSALAVWRSTTDLEGHARAGSALILEMLRRHTRLPTEPGIVHEAEKALQAEQALQDDMTQMSALLPGFANLTTVRIHENSWAAGKSLAQINLRAQTNASVLAVARGAECFAFPEAQVTLAIGDLVALAGAPVAIAQAKNYLHDPTGDSANSEA